MDVIGADDDYTIDYLCAVGAEEIAAKHGVTLDLEEQILSSNHRGKLWRAFREIANAVYAAGHGSETEDLPPPILTAQRPSSKYVAASLERLVSIKAKSYQEWAKEARIEEE